MIVSGDRDVYQLVRDGVRVMTTSRGVTDTKVYDHDGVVERYGVPPELVTDFIGLKGDTSDNIPGVPGIGDKTAAQLLQQFGDLEGVLGSVDEISGAKRKQNLTEHADDARVSKQLATMVEDVDVPLEITDQTRSTARPLASCATPPTSSSCAPSSSASTTSGTRSSPAAWSRRRSRSRPRRERPPTSPTARSHLAISAGRWAASDGAKVVAGDASDLAALAADLADRPLIAHDIKALGGHGPDSLMAAARPRSPRPQARHDGRRLPDRSRRGAPTTSTSSPPTPASPRRPPAPRKASSRSPPRRARRPATQRSTPGSRASSPSASASG